MRSGVLGVRSPGVAGATSRVRTATRRSSGVSEKGKPGLVEETAAQHAARHPVLDKTCARCVYHASRAQLERTYGSYAQHGDKFVRRHVADGQASSFGWFLGGRMCLLRAPPSDPC